MTVSATQHRRGAIEPVLSRGDADVAAVAAVLAEPARAQMLLALGDGRALPASTLAAEAGIAASTASGHLARLVDSGMVLVEPQGRHRYFRLAGPQVGELLEALAAVAPAKPITSLREGTRAHALRAARTCYDHLAGRLGVALFATLLDAGEVAGGDGRHDFARAKADRLSARGRDLDYRLTAAGSRHLDGLGVALPIPSPAGGGIALAYCVDWSEQRHHLAGAVGRALCDRLTVLGWVHRHPHTRAIVVTNRGRAGLHEHFGLDASSTS